MLVCKNRVKKPNQSLCLSCSCKQGVGEMDVLEVSASLFFEMPFLCQRLHYYLIPEYLALTKGKLGSGWSQQGGDSGRWFAQSCLQHGFGPNILQAQQLLDFWVTLSCSAPMFSSDPAPASQGSLWSFSHTSHNRISEPQK